MIDFLWPLISIGIFATIFLIGVYAIWKILKEKRLGFPTKDERTQKITGIAATYAFYIGLYFMAALMLGLIFLIVHWYFNRKGDL